MAEYFRNAKCCAPSKSGWFQARQKIKNQFFKDLFFATIKWHYRYVSDHRWKGFRVLGVDGTSFRVPDTKENRKYFGQHTNQYEAVASCRFVAWFDVWNDVLFHLERHSRKTSEKIVAEQVISNLGTDTISVYDRGYASTAIVWLHRYYGSHCIIRVNPDFSHIVKAFVASTKQDWVGDLRLGERAFYTLQQQFGMKNKLRKYEALPCRLIRIDLPTGQTEVLLTTLMDQHQFKTQHFDELYQKRWRVETCFDRLKNHLILGSFSGYKRQFVEQDIWATFIYHNVLAVFRKYAQDVRDIKHHDQRKYYYKINHNVAAGILQLYLPKMLEQPRARSDLIWKVLALMAKSAEAQRPHRSRPRNRKMLRLNDRHQTEKNYKRAF